MPEQTIQIKIEARSIPIKKELEKIVRTIEGVEIQNFIDKRPVDLLIFELGNEIEEDFRRISEIIDNGSAGEIFLTSGKMEPEVLLKAMRAGIKEFVSLPLTEQEVRDAIESFKSRQQDRDGKREVKSGQVFHVIGSKGGVGATTMAVNLAASLAEPNTSASVCLIDMKSVFGEVPLFLSLKPRYDWVEVVKNISRVDTTFIMNILCKHPSGIHLLSAPPHLNGFTGVTSDAMQRILQVLKRSFDYIVIDGGQSLDESSIKAVEMSDAVLIVSFLNIPALSNANRLLKSLYQKNVLSKERVKFVINRYVKKTDISSQDAEKSLNLKIFWKIPEDFKTTMAAINNGKTLREISYKAPVTRQIEAMAKSLVQKEMEAPKKRLFFWRR